MKHFNCPTCGHELTWESSANQSDLGIVDDNDFSSVNYYICRNCGCLVEQYDATDEEKCNFPYWDYLKTKN